MSDEKPEEQPGDVPQAPFPQPPYGQQPYLQPPSPQQPYDPTQPYAHGYPPQAYYSSPSYALPDHPQATTAMVLGIIAVVGGFTCGLPILASPFAWVIGYRSRRAIQREPQRYGGESKATAGMVMGIIGTVLLALVIIAIVVIIIVAVNDPSAFDDSGNL